MKLILIRLTIALLTFTIGVALVSSYQAVSQYRVKMALEAELRKELFLIRRSIDQFVSDKGSTPKSLNDLVTTGYLREIPVDPITGKRNWEEHISVVCSDCGWCVPELVDVNSVTITISSDGTPYSKW
jgi:general secretion pathway protein G